MSRKSHRLTGLEHLQGVANINERFPLIVLTVLVFLLSLCALPANAQTTLQSIGVPQHTNALPVEQGFVYTNGDLHLDIPLGSYPQRGGSNDNISLVYDSQFWTVYEGYQWWAPSAFDTAFPPVQLGLGWQLVVSGDGGEIDASETTYDFDDCDPDPDYITYSPWYWTGPDGTQHSFNSAFTQQGWCGSTTISTSSAYADDGSGYYISISDVTAATVYAPDGTIYYTDATTGATIKIDSNGNKYTRSASYGPLDLKYFDTLSSTLPVVEITANSDYSQVYFDVRNEKGSTSRYTANLETVTLNTNFDDYYYETSGPYWKTIENIEFPDSATEYQFTYDSGSGGYHYGEMTQMTLPALGQINYTYNTFPSLGYTRWLTQRVTPDSSTGWTYSPAASGAYDAALTVKKPTDSTNEKAVYTGVGGYPLVAQYYDASSNLVAQISNCYNHLSPTSSTCSYSSMSANYLNGTTTTVYPSSGSPISQTTKYTWDSSSNGNLTEMQEWNFGSSTSGSADRSTSYTYYSSGTFGTTGKVINRPATITVTNSSGTVVAKTVNSYDGSTPTGISSVAQHDDAHYSSSFNSRGNLTSVESYTSSSAYLPTATMTYDATGQMLTSTDENSNTTSFSYTDEYVKDIGDSSSPTSDNPSVSTNAFPTSVTLANGKSYAFSYYWGTGQLAEIGDPNSLTTTFHFYDPMNRPTSTKLPSNGWSLTSYASVTETDNYTGITSSSETTSCPSSGTGCRQNQTKFDSLGRVQHKNLVSDPVAQDSVDTTYDADGRMYTMSNPHRSASSPTDGTTQYNYDTMNRLNEVTGTDGGAAYTYYGATVSSNGGRGSQICSGYGSGYPILQKDEASRLRQSWVDGFGRLIEVDEPDPSSGSLSSGSPTATCYSYDLNNNLTYVLQNSSRARTYAYDLLSRPTSTSDPEKGTVNYYYTTSGSGYCSGNPTAVCRQTDARSTTITSSYDSLNRLTQQSYSDSTPTVYYIYDGGTPSPCSVSSFSFGSIPIGHLTAICDGAGSEGWRFANVTGGTSVTDQRTTNSVTETTTSTYNYDGSLYQLAYPTSRTITYAPTAGVGPSSAEDTANSINYVTSASYAPPGELASLLNGSSFILTRYYDERLQPCRIAVNSSGTAPNSCSDSTNHGNVMDLTYNYNLGSSDNGTVAGITNNLDSTRSQSYSYDYLNRLAQAAGSTYSSSPSHCWGESYTLDSWANLTAITPLGGSYSGCTQESGTSISVGTSNGITSSGFSYDSSGNMTVGPTTSDTYSFNAEDQMTQAAVSSTVGYVYDGLGRRVEKTTSDTPYKLYWYDQAGNAIDETDGSGSFSNSTFNEYVFFNGQGISRRDYSGNIFYYFSDHLGTAREIVQSGYTSPCSDADFYPYGGERTITASCTGNYLFTGQELDPESNLYHFPARYYSSGLGRWNSPDPLGGNITDPQSLNRYTYVRNNPLNLTDPAGMNYEGCNGNCDDGYFPSEGSDPPCPSCYDYGPEPQHVFVAPPPYLGVTPPIGTPLPGFLATGPGFDYNWADLLFGPPCSGGLQGNPCIKDLHNDPNGNLIGDETGEQLCRTDDVCVFWNPFTKFWDPDLYNIQLQPLAAQVVKDGANEHFIFGVYGASVAVGAGGWAFGTYYPAGLGWVLSNWENLGDCAAGALSPIPGGPGLWGNTCSVLVNGGQQLWQYRQQNQ